MAGLLDTFIKRAGKNITTPRRSTKGTTVEGEFDVINEGGLLPPPSPNTTSPLFDMVTPQQPRRFTPAQLFAGGTAAGIAGGSAIPFDELVNTQSEDAKALARQEQEQQQTAVVDEAKREIQASGGGQEELNFFDKISNELDLFTLGASLLASNDGSRSFGQNLGRAALLAARAQGGKKEAARKAGLDERRVRAAEKNAAANLARAIKDATSSSQKNLKTSGVEVKQGMDIAQTVLGLDFGKKPDASERMFGQWVARQKKDIESDPQLQELATARGVSAVELSSRILASRVQQFAQQNGLVESKFLGMGEKLDEEALTRAITGGQ